MKIDTGHAIFFYYDWKPMYFEFKFGFTEHKYKRDSFETKLQVATNLYIQNHLKYSVL